MKKTKKQFKEWITKQVKYYLPILGLQMNEVLIKHNNEVSYLEISCTYPYLDPTIKFSDVAFKEWQEGLLLKDRILHELCHMLTDPLYCKAIARYVTKDEMADERERLTDTFTAIVRKLLK